MCQIGSQGREALSCTHPAQGLYTLNQMGSDCLEGTTFFHLQVFACSLPTHACSILLPFPLSLPTFGGLPELTAFPKRPQTLKSDQYPSSSAGNTLRLPVFCEPLPHV